MALVFADRVKDTSATTGTGTYTLANSAPTGFQTFGAGIGNGNTCYYGATDGTNWECGLGTYTSAGTTLARTTITASSNSGSAVNWSSTVTLFCDISAGGYGVFPGLVNISAAAAGQIAFPATQNASAGTNTLDDYKEGTFTPTVQFGGAAVGVTYGGQTGRYVKVGKMVQVMVDFTLTNKGSSTGQLTILGLPFTAGAGGGVLPVGYWDGTASVTWITEVIGASSTTITVWNGGATTAATFTNTNATNTLRIFANGVYEAAN